MFVDRRDAGRRLASAVDQLQLREPQVVALPRGGVPVGFEVAQRLGAPLDVLVVRKLGAPTQPEFGFGAVAEGGVDLIDEASCRAIGLRPAEREAVVVAERRELERRVSIYRAGVPALDVTGRDVVVVDDGLATGVTARAALAALEARGADRLVLAIPVGAPETADQMRDLGIEVMCLERPRGFTSVGSWSRRFDQTTDDEVLRLLERARRPPH
jgi:predicted phosphoribosyltransferase